MITFTKTQKEGDEHDRYFAAYWYPLSSSIMLVLATVFSHLWPLIFVALVPLFLNFFSVQKVRKIIFSVLIVGVPYSLAVGWSLFHLSGTWWINDGGIPNALNTLGYVVFIFLILFFGQAFYLIPMLVASRIKSLIIPTPLLLGLLFALVEFIRSSVFVAGYSWGALGYLLVDAWLVKHIASLFSVYGLTFVIILCNAWIASLIRRYVKNDGDTVRRLKNSFAAQHTRETIILISLFIAILLFGAYRESRPIRNELNLRVAVIASQISTPESINESAYNTYRSLFMQALKDDPNIILTPENIFPYFTIDEDGYVLARWQSVYLPNAQKLYGDFLSLTKAYPHTTFAISAHSEKNTLLYNSILLYRDGTVLSVYHKRRPVPFSEYEPLGLDLPLFENLAKGDNRQNFQLDGMPLAGYVCSEIGITPLTTHGAKLILSPSNDSVFGGDQILLLHHRIARMRALEKGAYLLRSTKGGISSIINPYGKAIATMSGQNGVFIVDIP